MPQAGTEAGKGFVAQAIAPCCKQLMLHGIGSAAHECAPVTQ